MTETLSDDIHVILGLDSEKKNTIMIDIFVSICSQFTIKISCFHFELIELV
jgi:hypothetical protein